MTVPLGQKEKGGPDEAGPPFVFVSSCRLHVFRVPRRADAAV